MVSTSVLPANPGSKPKKLLDQKLLDQTRDVLRLKHYSLRTERLMKCVRLRVKDVDFGYSRITVLDGKGAKVAKLL